MKKLIKAHIDSVMSLDTTLVHLKPLLIITSRSLTNIPLVFLLVPVFIFWMTGCSHPSTPQKSCEPWAEISQGEYLITNNVWGAKKANNIKQCISTTGDEIEWTWSWKGRNGNVLAYPSILFGHKPWSNQSTTSKLPLKISDIDDFHVFINATQEGTGSHNLLLEAWVTSAAIPTPTTRMVEVAIHLSQQNWPGMPGSKVDTATIDGHLFDIYVDPKIDVPGDDWHWMYLGFVYKGKKSIEGKIDMTAFIDYSKKNKYIQSEHYLSSIELGSELVDGTGKAKVKHFSVKF